MRFTSSSERSAPPLGPNRLKPYDGRERSGLDTTDEVKRMKLRWAWKAVLDLSSRREGNMALAMDVRVVNDGWATVGDGGRE